ncbi:MAG TPA: hypothetical protein VJ546_10605 [Bacillales bacterium]|nr:hypothetical protein [Bacillales bacterium]
MSIEHVVLERILGCTARKLGEIEMKIPTHINEPIAEHVMKNAWKSVLLH